MSAFFLGAMITLTSGQCNSLRECCGTGELTWSIHVLQRTVKERLKQLRQTTSDSFSAEADDTKMQNSRNFKTTQMIGTTVQRSGDEMDCNPTEYSIYR